VAGVEFSALGKTLQNSSSKSFRRDLTARCL